MRNKRVHFILTALLIASMSASVMAGCGTPGTDAGTNAGTKAEKKTEEVIAMPDNVDKIVEVNYENRSLTNNGVFEGFGTALCWWANRIGYSDALSEQAAELFYGEDGLRFNIMRYNIGGGDDPTHNHIKRTDSAVPGWMVMDDNGEFVYDYEADARQLNVLKRCYEKAVNPYVEVFSNSAPYFMTVSGCTGGAVIPSDNNLKPECYGDFANYLAHVSKYINDELNISVNSVSPINEPDTNYWGANSEKQEGCHTDPGEAQSAVIVETAKAFDAVGLNSVEIVASDETSTIKAYSSYNKYTDEAKKELDRISTHTYDTTGIKSLAKLRATEGFNLWMSEVDGSGSLGKNAGEMGSAIYIADKIIKDINTLDSSAWVMWQVIDNHISSEGFNGNKDSGMVDVMGGFWGAAVADHDKENIILTQKYYGIGQITRYINAGDTIIRMGDSPAIAAYDEAAGTLTIVAYNIKDEDVLFGFDIQGFNISGSVEVVRTSGSVANGEQWKTVDTFSTSGWNRSYTLKPNSINTFIISGVSR